MAGHFSFEEWGRFLPEHTTAVSLLDRLLHHAVVCVTDGERFRMREARQPLRFPQRAEIVGEVLAGLHIGGCCAG